MLEGVHVDCGACALARSPFHCNYTSVSTLGLEQGDIVHVPAILRPLAILEVFPTYLGLFEPVDGGTDRACRGHASFRA